MANLTDRKNFYKKILVDNNLEIDVLGGAGIGFGTEEVSPPTYTVKQSDLGRIDMISYNVYGTVSYWGLIAERNDIIDVENDLFTGQKLIIPSLVPFFNYYNKNVKPADPIEETFTTREL